MRLIESTYISLDGMVTGDAFWGAQQGFQGDAHNQHAATLLGTADALLLGRQTYDVFSVSWPERPGELADLINPLPKYVASRTLTEATWNTKVLHGDAVEAVAELKKSREGTLLKYGTGSFSRALVDAGLLDELQLWVHPFVAGSGERLLPGISPTQLALAAVTEVGNGVVILTYAPNH
ncbi:dihydrofolate reductase [Kribbella sp. VKM Ac-2569]|uniref:dihydrofolate reductase family protein n=1 Tax=Kribbella sp. VKM Ac-2569 TaxID=2512220 RepID=UPI00102CBE10|nr:dihydrofolate reductase family protein [Kribbella sp. VKM Ac-2569]RZT14687.1 dihydrofolate reductase [Kribbella sp. VKM Ac-2569]